jgi:hypothetical protein
VGCVHELDEKLKFSLVIEEIGGRFDYDVVPTTASGFRHILG